MPAPLFSRGGDATGDGVAALSDELGRARGVVLGPFHADLVYGPFEHFVGLLAHELQLVLVVQVQSGGEGVIHEGLDVVLDARGLLGGRAHHGDLPVGVHRIASSHLMLLDDTYHGTGFGSLVGGGQSGIARAYDEHLGLLVPVDIGRIRGSVACGGHFALGLGGGASRKSKGGQRSRGRDAFQKVATRARGADRCVCFPYDLLDGHGPLLFPFVGIDNGANHTSSTRPFAPPRWVEPHHPKGLIGGIRQIESVILAMSALKGE